METKQCPRCKSFKLFNAFNKCKSRKDGLQTYCKNCQCERQREFYKKKGPSKIYERRLERGEDFIEKRNAYSKIQQKKPKTVEKRKERRRKATELLENSYLKYVSSRLTGRPVGRPRHNEDIISFGGTIPQKDIPEVLVEFRRLFLTHKRIAYNNGKVLNREEC